MSLLTESTFHFEFIAFIVSGQGHPNVIFLVGVIRDYDKKELNKLRDNIKKIVFHFVFYFYYYTFVIFVVSVIKYYNRKELNKPHEKINTFCERR